MALSVRTRFAIVRGSAGAAVSGRCLKVFRGLYIAPRSLKGKRYQLVVWGLGCVKKLKETANLPAVNRLVAGSNPARGATPKISLWFLIAFSLLGKCGFACWVDSVRVPPSSAQLLCRRAGAARQRMCSAQPHASSHVR